jgi:PadR family transcriptional regulator, regulatory protein PadR
MPHLGKSQLDLLLLGILAAGPAHGYAVITELKARSEGAFDLPEGTVYPALHRLEGQGLVQSSRDTVNGRARRVYSLTRAGRAELRRGRESFERNVKNVRAVLAVATS